MTEAGIPTVKSWKLRVTFSGEEAQLLPKVEVSSLSELKETIAKEFPDKYVDRSLISTLVPPGCDPHLFLFHRIAGKTFSLKALDDDFGDFFTLNDKIFASLPAEGHRDIQVVRGTISFPHFGTVAAVLCACFSSRTLTFRPFLRFSRESEGKDSDLLACVSLRLEGENNPDPSKDQVKKEKPKSVRYHAAASVFFPG